MEIIFLAHPAYLKLRSMDNFTEMLATGMKSRGHDINVWHPTAVFSKLPFGKMGKKWLGYLDQFLIFPAKLRFKLIRSSNNTLYVFTDQALGPWVPIFKNRRHVIHCHDFLALQSAKDLIPENITSWTGKQYQAFIKRGFVAGKNFICVSHNTRENLKQIIASENIRNVVVHNGLNSCYNPVNQLAARCYIQNNTGILLRDGFILHVGGNQWYKNRLGVIEIYDAWRQTSDYCLPLVMVGETPSLALLSKVQKSRYKNDIHFLYEKDTEFVINAYSGATILLFPSLAEGFGWPIAEAMACGCRVITTNQAPMTEVGGEAAYYIERRPNKSTEIRFWAHGVADLMQSILKTSKEISDQRIKKGFENANRFNLNDTLDMIEDIYLKVVER